jgi:AbrB family looped-hinge helix DNA binding protein
MMVKLKDTRPEGVVTRIGKGARVVIPAALRKALALHPGDPVVLRVEQDTLRLIPLRQAIAEAQHRVRQYIPVGTALVESLLQERRREAQRG